MSKRALPTPYPTFLHITHTFPHFPHSELLPMPPITMTPTSLTARIHELISACFTGIWLETCEPEEACREISSLCQTQSWRLASWDCDVGLKIHGHELSTQHNNPAPTLAPTLADTTDPLAVIRSAGQLSQGADLPPPHEEQRVAADVVRHTVSPALRAAAHKPDSGKVCIARGTSISQFSIADRRVSGRLRTAGSLERHQLGRAGCFTARAINSPCHQEALPPYPKK